MAKSGRICRGNSGPVRARITLALQLNVRFFTEGTYARSPGAAACVQIVSLAIPTPKLGGFSPTRAESAHCKLVASVGFVAGKFLQSRELEEQTAARVLEGDRQAEMHAGIDDLDREFGSAISDEHSLLLPVIEGRQTKDLIRTPKSALRKTVESNAPAGARCAEPYSCH